MGWFEGTALKAHAIATQAQLTADRSLLLIEKHLDECAQERRMTSAWRSTTDAVLRGQNADLKEIKVIVAGAQRWVITTLVLILLSGVGWGLASAVHVDIGASAHGARAR